MSSQIDCPICMDCIESTTKNCVTTECGHRFHTNCLMQSVAHNGFGCPYCRTKMAEEAEEETVYSDEEGEEMFDDNALRGFRFFWNNINGDENDADDDADEQQIEEEWEDVDDGEDEIPDIPSANFVAEKLRLNNVSYEDLVKIILLRDHEEYQDQEDEERTERLDGEIFGKIRIVLSNYTPEQVVTQEPVSVTQEPITEVDFTAQPKRPPVSSFTRFRINV